MAEASPASSESTAGQIQKARSPRSTARETACDDFVDAGVGDGGGDDFLTVGGLFADDRDIEIAVDGERHGARDGRGAHHQHVGAGAFGGELQAVGDAEAVLLVDDDEGEVWEFDVGLIERLCAGEDLDLAGADIVEDRFATGALVAAGQRGDADAGGSEEAADGVGLLAREDFGGGHQRGDAAGGGDLRSGEGGDERLAGADIALDHAAHGSGAAHVDGDILVGVHLAACRREGQRIDDGLLDADGAGDGRMRDGARERGGPGPWRVRGRGLRRRRDAGGRSRSLRGRRLLAGGDGAEPA